MIRQLVSILTLRRAKSIRVKALSIILSVTVAVLLLIVAFTFTQSRAVIADTTAYGMRQQLASVVNEIEGRLAVHARVAESLARAAEARHGSSDLGHYRSVNERMLGVNADTFGLGVFFEPGVVDPAVTYYSTYAYKAAEGQIVSTEDYNDPAYDYHNQDWYKIVGEQGERGTRFTPPYHDETTGVTLVTTAVPMFDASDRFIGVTTGDIDLATIRQAISETVVGGSGWTFLLSADGAAIAGSDGREDMAPGAPATENANASFAALAAEMLEKRSGNGSFTTDAGLHHVYYASVPTTEWLIGIVMPERELAAPTNRLLTSVSLIALAGVALLVAVIFLFTTAIVKQIRKFNRLSEAMAAGDFTHAVAVDTSDEFGAMANNFNRTQAVLKDMLHTVSDHARHVSDTARRLNEGAEQSSEAAAAVSGAIQSIAAGAATQLVSTQESARALEEMSVGIQRIAEAASNASNAVSDVAQRTTSGNEMMRSAEGQMGAVSQTVGEAAELIRKLGGRSAEITRIVDVIADISNQTNLLALNASIEAARAGAEGRGFAVVAGEVKKLALQTNDSARQIAQLVHAIRAETLAAVGVMEASSAEVGKGASVLHEAGRAFRDILEGMTAISAQMTDISASSEQLSAGSQQVSASVGELSGIARLAADETRDAAASSEEQAATIQEMNESARRLNRMTEELRQLVSKFRL